MGKLAEATQVVNDLSRKELLAELRRIAAGLDRPLESADLNTATWRAIWREFGSIAKARRAAGLPDPLRYMRWTEETVIEEIRKLSRDGVIITYRELIGAGRGDLHSAITEYFGSIVRARRLAGVPDPPYRKVKRERWDAQRVTQEILARHGDGEPLAYSKVPARLIKAARRYYETWENAIEAAGLDYDEVRLQRAPYTKRELLDLLREFAAKQPEMTRTELYQVGYHPSLVQHFGSIDEALRRAGLDHWPTRLREPTMSREDVVKALRARRRAGKATYWHVVQQEDFHLWYSGMNQFGEWERAIEAAGLDSDAPQNRWTRESILDALRERLKQGKSLKPADMKREARELYGSTLTYFDRYLDAVHEVGDAPWELTKWTPELIIDELRRRAAGRNRITTRDAGSRLVQAAQNHFGSFTAACHAAGLATSRDPARKKRAAAPSRRARRKVSSGTRTA